MLSAAGFADVTIDIKSESEEIISAWMPGSNAEQYVASAYVTATKAVSPVSVAAPQDDVFAPVAEPEPVQITQCDDGSAAKAGC